MIDAKSGQEVDSTGATADSWVDEYDRVKMEGDLWAEEYGAGATASKVSVNCCPVCRSCLSLYILIKL